MTVPGGHGGRHSDPEGLFGSGFAVPRYEPARYDPPAWDADAAAGRFQPADADAGPDRPTTGFRRVSGVLDRHEDVTGPLVEPEWWSYGSSDDPHYPPMARQGRDDRPAPDAWVDHDEDGGNRHPSAPLPPLPTGAWDRLRARGPHGGDDDATVAQPLVQPPTLDSDQPGEHTSDPVGRRRAHDDETDAHAPDPDVWEDQTGGLEVIGAHVEEEPPRRSRRARREAREAADAAAAADAHRDVSYAGADSLVHDETSGEDIPVKPYDPRTARARRRRRPIAVLTALLVLAGVVVGIVVGGQQLLTLLDPSSRDFPGQGTGSVEIRVREGDTLSDIARTLAEAGVIASVGPFVDAAEANADSVGIQPGVYQMRNEMSGQAALDNLLDPASRLLSRITLPEGLTVQRTLAKLAEETGRPVEEFEAAAADPAALGLPPYANGNLEGFLFPATYEIEPDTTPAEILGKMVATYNEVAGRLQLEQRAAALGRTPFEVVTVASMVESETRLDEERPDVAQVIYNRLDSGIALGIDATLAYGLQKSGNDLTVADLQTDGPYNTRTRPGLPPTPISAPGEASLEAALSPSSGNLLYYVLESADGSHFFTDDYAEFQAARQRCADADLGCGG